MKVALFLNELSLTPLALDVAAGRARMSAFLDVVTRVRQVVRSARPLVHTIDPIHALPLAPGYSVADWSVGLSRDERLLFLQLATQAPLLEGGRDPQELIDRHLRSECWHDGRSAVGLGAAFAADGLSVSFRSAQCWDEWALHVEVDEADEEANVTRRKAVVRHASVGAHIDAHERLLRELERLSVRDGQDLWDRRAELFPALEFCKEVRGQLTEFLGGDIALDGVVKRLVDLQKFFDAWDGASIGPGSLPTKCTPESGTTLGKYEQQHTFTPPVGPRRVFSWHVRFTPGVGRIFFDGDAARRRGIIGCVTKVGLPTVKDPT